MSQILPQIGILIIANRHARPIRPATIIPKKSRIVLNSSIGVCVVG